MLAVRTVCIGPSSVSVQKYDEEEEKSHPRFIWHFLECECYLILFLSMQLVYSFMYRMSIMQVVAQEQRFICRRFNCVRRNRNYRWWKFRAVDPIMINYRGVVTQLDVHRWLCLRLIIGQPIIDFKLSTDYRPITNYWFLRLLCSSVSLTYSQLNWIDAITSFRL